MRKKSRSIHTPENITIINSATSITGDFESKETIIFAGTLDGSLICKNKVKLEKGGLVQGNLVSQFADIYGTVQGDVLVHDKLTICETGVIEGSIYCKSFEVLPGATLNGTIQTGDFSEFSQLLNTNLSSTAKQESPDKEVAPRENEEVGSEAYISNNKLQDVIVGIPGKRLPVQQTEAIQNACSEIMELIGFRLEVHDKPELLPYFHKQTFRTDNEDPNSITYHFNTLSNCLNQSLSGESLSNCSPLITRAIQHLLQVIEDIPEISIKLGSILFIKQDEEETFNYTIEAVSESLEGKFRKEPRIINQPEKLSEYLKVA